MSSISIICLSGFLILFLSLFKKGTDIFSPARLFLLVWLLAIGLADLKLSRYQQEWSTFSWIMLILPLVSMLSGIFIVYVLNVDKKIHHVIEIRSLLNEKKIDFEKLFRFIIYLFIAYIVSYVISFLVIGFLPLFTKYPGVARNDWGLFGFGLFIQAFPSISYLIVIYFILNKNNRNRIISSLILFITFVTYAFLLQRYYIVFAIIITVVSLYYLTNYLRTRNVLIIIIITLAIVFSMTLIRLSGTIVNYLYYLSDMRYEIDYAIFTEPYMYITMNLENFSNAVANMDQFTYGVFTFDFIFALTGIKHNLIEYLGLTRYPFLITNNYNTYTMFFVYYWDFGIFGLGIIPFLLGMSFSKIYYKMKTNPTLNSVAIYSIVAFVIIFSFFVPIVTFLHFVFNLVLIYYITTTIVKTEL